MILGKKEIKAKEKSYVLIGICEAKKRTLLSIGKFKKILHISRACVLKKRKKKHKIQVKSHTHLVWILLQIGIFIWGQCKIWTKYQCNNGHTVTFDILTRICCWNIFSGHNLEYPGIMEKITGILNNCQQALEYFFWKIFQKSLEYNISSVSNYKCDIVLISTWDMWHWCDFCHTLLLWSVIYGIIWVFFS